MFQFHPELFERRAEVMALLAEAGLEWFTDYSAVDLLHDNYGLEILGLKTESDAQRVQGIVQGRFPSWRFTRRYLRDHKRDPGWKVVVHRDPEQAGGGGVAQG